MTADKKWIPCVLLLPDNGQVVMTKVADGSSSRNEQLLKRQNNLWFIPDGSTYVYYTPTHWQSK